MRIWDRQLIPYLCNKHLVAMWREGLGCANIIIYNKQGYRNHPATQEYLEAPKTLLNTLKSLLKESKHRGYHFNASKLQDLISYTQAYNKPDNLKQWQTIEEQIQTIKNKHCLCKV